MRTTARTKYQRKWQRYAKYKRRKARRRQHRGFLNRYDLVYAGWDTVNQAVKGPYMLAPKLINQTSKEIDKIVEARIKHVINNGGQQIQKIAAQIIRGAIEEVYKTSFRLLGNLGKQRFSQLRQKLLRIIKRKWVLKDKLWTKSIMAALHVKQMTKESWLILKSVKDVCCLHLSPFGNSQASVVVACRQRTQQKRDSCWTV